ncbi:MAG TPA: nucleotidyltransferase family protein [Allosphingosinicella sp.]|nr:nucleotidyltransferase family protein [Allosphingosinicella sp.]
MGDWTAIVLAGNRPGENAFAESHGVAAKALIPVSGEPMLGRVVRALLQCPSVGRIVILAQVPERLLEGDLAWIEAEPRISTATAGEGISNSILTVAGGAQAPWPVLVVTADHALLRPEMVQTFITRAADADAAFAVVERSVVERAYPTTRRTWLKFSDGHYSGANLFALTSHKAQAALSFWARAERDRKKALKLLLFFGPLIFLRALTRTISLDGAADKAGSDLRLALKAVRLPFAEAAIDVDKPSDLELVEQILSAPASASL